MLKTTLLASAFAALVLVPTAASAGDRGGHREHFVRAPNVVIVLPHRHFVFHDHLRAWHPKPKVWHKPAPRHKHAWRGDRDDHRRWDGDHDRRWKRDDHRRGPGHGHRSPDRHWRDGKRHFAGSPSHGRRRD